MLFNYKEANSNSNIEVFLKLMNGFPLSFLLLLPLPLVVDVYKPRSKESLPDPDKDSNDESKDEYLKGEVQVEGSDLKVNKNLRG